MSEPLVIGVDGGGTKTEAWLAPLAGGPPLGRGMAGPGNPRAAGFEVAQANIEAAIKAAFAEAKVPRAPVAAACFGLAGAGRPAEQEQIAAWARSRGIASAVSVTGDAEPILAAGSAENWGIALICGTGSLAWGRNRASETGRCGGWGYLLGDEGSGYAIALAGLRLTVRSADGRDPQTQLLPRFQRRLAAATPQELVERIYSPSLNREAIAALAVEVFTAAADEDELAILIFESAAADLAEMVGVLAGRLGLPAGRYPLVLAGSVLLNQPALERSVLKELAIRGAQPQSTARISDPVRGAVSLARLAAAGA